MNVRIGLFSYVTCVVAFSEQASNIAGLSDLVIREETSGTATFSVGVTDAAATYNNDISMTKTVGGAIVSRFLLRLEILHVAPVSPSITSFAGPARQTAGVSSTYIVTIGAGDIWTNLRVQIFYRTTLFGNWLEIDDETYTPVGSDPVQDNPLPLIRQHRFTWAGLDGAGTAYLEVRVTASKGVAPNTLTATTTTAQTSTIFSAAALPLPTLPTVKLEAFEYQNGRLVARYSDGDSVPSGANVTFSVTTTGGGFDEGPTYRWFVNSVRVFGATGLAHTINSPADGEYLIEVNVTVYGRGRSYRAATLTTSPNMRLTWAPDTSLDDAETPNISLRTKTLRGHVGQTIAITPVLSGGAYDTIRHRWVDSELSDNPWGDGAPSTYNSALQSVGEKMVTLYLEVTGTGTNANAGTSDTGSEFVNITVLARLPAATAPTNAFISFNPSDPSVYPPSATSRANAGVTITAAPSGGVYDILEYSWKWQSGTNSLSGSLRTFSFNPYSTSERGSPPIIFTVLLTITAYGNGTRAQNGTSAVYTRRIPVRYRLPLAVAPDIRSLTTPAGAGGLPITGEVVQITADIDYTGSNYDTIEHRWTWEGGDNAWADGAPSTVFDFSSSTAGRFLVQLEIRVRGTGTRAVDYNTDPLEGQDTVIEEIWISVAP